MIPHDGDPSCVCAGSLAELCAKTGVNIEPVRERAARIRSKSGVRSPLGSYCRDEFDPSMSGGFSGV